MTAPSGPAAASVSPPPVFTVETAGPRLSAAERTARSADAGFGTAFTEHMVTARWSAERGWHDGRVLPYGSLPMDPATVGLHYGQVVFEGLKAYRGHDGRIGVFRPHAHAERFAASAGRLVIPELPVSTFVSAVEALLDADADWVPGEPGRSLYLRPLLYASEPRLALRPATEYGFLLLAFVTEGFFGGTVRPVDVWVSEEYVRAYPGGTGAVKFAGNYAPSYAAQAQAEAHGCRQVVWLDATERRWVEELGGMNVFFVYGEGADARLVTPPVSGTILPGITRGSLLTLAGELGLAVAEERISVDRWREDCASGAITEVFACGTAAHLSPVGRVRSAGGEFRVGTGETGRVTAELADRLTRIHRGHGPDPHGWLHVLDRPV
ncbi:MULTISPECIES: branched-chain amino acid aminotransferase [unclassified Streptomyces]|uniref:branched-chain amino acid aminotransferase n=1 Tax=unclassified Streptomyces TaxID=2593676 RepID=UPI003823919A